MKAASQAAPEIAEINGPGKGMKAPSKDEVKHGNPTTRESYH